MNLCHSIEGVIDLMKEKNVLVVPFDRCTNSNRIREIGEYLHPIKEYVRRQADEELNGLRLDPGERRALIEAQRKAFLKNFSPSS